MRMTLSRPRVTIERLRTLVLIGGALLVAAIVAFLAAGQWTRRFLTKDLPHRLGIDIEQSADGVNYTQTRKGKTIFKIHAARALKMKGDGKTELQDVHIDLYGEDGNRTDTISGAEFEYDPNGGLATAAGAVEITLMRPGVKPAIAQLKPGASKANSGSEPMVPKGRGTSAATDSKGAGTAGGAGNAITDNEIHVKTSGLTFNQKTGIATTAEQVDFVLRQGRGSSIGAVYDSTGGELVLDHAVVLHAERGVSGDGTAASNRGPVTIHASHAEFEREEMACRLTQARADYSGGSAQATDALVHFREDGSVIRLDGSGGVDLRTDTGSHVTAPVGSLDFDESNHPHLGVLRGGAHIETTRASRQVQGSAPTARLTFDSKGELSLAHLEQGVAFTSEQQGTTAKGMAVQLHRTWQSQSADVVFAPAGPLAQSEAAPVLGRVQPSSHVEARTIRGFGGVVVNSESTSGGVRAPSRFAADSMVAELAAGGALSSLFGTGHASLDERTAAGVHQASSADQLEVRFAPASAGARSAPAAATKAKDSEAAQIASVVEIGHVVLVQDPSPARPGQAGDAGDAEVAKSGIRATANRADYDGQSQLLHLTGTPRVVDGPLDMTANRIDFARVSGDAFAHGDVRASWVGGAGSGTSLLAGTGSGQNANGPVHAIAAEAELHQATQEVIFKGTGAAGNPPRLWQSVNSVSAPVITLNRQKQTLTAVAGGAANPVRTVLVSNGAMSFAKTELGQDGEKQAGEKKRPDAPSVIRVRSGDLHYSEGQRLAIFRSGAVGSVTAETTGKDGPVTVVSDQAEVQLPPEAKHPSNGAGTAAAGGSAQASSSTGPVRALGPSNAAIDRLTAQGHVSVDWPGRRGTGEKLVYRGDDGTYTLTGTSTLPPRITDPVRGTVTGSALIFHGGDDSVTVEGDGGKTVTETRSKK